MKYGSRDWRNGGDEVLEHSAALREPFQNYRPAGLDKTHENIPTIALGALRRSVDKMEGSRGRQFEVAFTLALSSHGGHSGNVSERYSNRTEVFSAENLSVQVDFRT